MQLILFNTTGSTLTFLSGAISVSGGGSTAVTNTAQQLALALDGALRFNIFANNIYLSDGTNNFGETDGLNYLYEIVQFLGPTSDGLGNNITSTLVGSKQSLDVNVSQSVTSTDKVGSGTITALNGTVSANSMGCSTTTFTITGTWAGVLQIQGSVDNTNWVDLNGTIQPAGQLQSTMSSNGTIAIPCGGFQSVRLIATSFSSGTANITYDASIGNIIMQVVNGAYSNLSMEPYQPTASNLNAQVVGNVAAGSTDSGNGIKISGIYSASLPALTAGQRGDIQLDSSSRPIIVGAGVAGTPAGGVLSIQGVVSGQPVIGNITQIAGNAINTGAGATSTGTARVAANTYDGSGNAITSTTINSKQRLDINLSSEGVDNTTAPFGTQQVGGIDPTGKLQAFEVLGSGEQFTRDLINVGFQYRTIALAASTATQALGAATILVNRKVIQVMCSNAILYWGTSNAVTATNAGGFILPNNAAIFSFTDNVPLWIYSTTASSVFIFEGS